MSALEILNSIFGNREVRPEEEKSAEQRLQHDLLNYCEAISQSLGVVGRWSIEDDNKIEFRTKLVGPPVGGFNHRTTRLEQLKHRLQEVLPSNEAQSRYYRPGEKASGEEEKLSEPGKVGVGIEIDDKSSFGVLTIENTLSLIHI